MADMGNAVTAMLKLDATNFNSGIKSATTAIKQLQSAANSNRSFQSLANSLRTFRKELTELESASSVSNKALSTLSSNITRVGNALSVVKKFETEVQIFKTMASSVKQFNSALNSLVASQTNTTSSVNTLSNSVRSMSSSMASARNTTASLTSTLSTLGSASSIATSGINSTSNSLRTMSSSNAGLISSVNSSKSSLSTLNTSVSTTSTSLNQLSSKATSTGNSVKTMGSSASTSASNVSKLGSSASTATSGVNNLTNSVAKSSQTAKAADGRYKTLSNTLFSLRGITSMVGAMFAFNLVQGFIDSTQQSINAKSQMEAYQKTLGLSENSISRFNKKLDETVSIYKKMNKYSLGETVAGLGIEFDLSEKQMEGMMKTVARLQSEYLRAGRSAEEADLAVKDIMQGEFLRLSRETGVGKTDLQALGWSGDTKDIESLQRALDKVADQRNWDAFATQATSLSDVLQILKNRFGEFVADLTSVVTPGIVAAFNAISNVFNGISNWYKGSSFFTQGMTQFLGIASAIGVLTTALIAYKGHMGLAEIAQAGFLRSLLGVTLGFDKSVIATNSAATMLKAWVAGTDVATASAMTFKGALATKILGLNQASVATNGVTTTLIAMARGYEVAENGALKFAQGTSQFIAAEKQLNEIMSATGVHIDLNAEKISKYATHMETAGIQSLSFTQKLAALNKDVSVAEASTMSTTQALKAFAGSATAAGLAVSAVLVVALIAVAAAFAMVYDNCQQTKEQIEAFNDAVENGNDIIKDAKNRADFWEEEESGSKRAKAAADDYQATLEAIQHIRSVDAQINKAKDQTELDATAKLSETYKQLGMDESQARQMANYNTNQALAGSNKAYKAAQKYNDAITKGTAHEAGHAEMIAKTSGNQKKAIDYVSEYNAELYSTQQAWSEWNQGDMWAGLAASVGELKLWWFDFSSWIDAGLEGFMKDPLKGIKGFGQYLWDSIIGDDFIHEGGLVDQFLDWIGGGVSGIEDKFNSSVVQPLQEAWNNFMSDPLGALGDFAEWGIEELLNSFLNSGNGQAFTQLWNWFNNSFLLPLQEAWNTFASDPLGYLMSGVEFGLGMLLDALLGNGEENGYTVIWNWFYNGVILPLQQAWSQFTSDPLGYLQGVVMDLNALLSKLIGDDPVASVWNFVNTTIIQPFSQAIQNGLANIPILGTVLQMLGLIDGANGTSSEKGRTLGEMFKQAIEYVIGSIPIVGDILRILGLIDSTNGTANQKGQNVGKNIKDGEKSGQDGTSDNVSAEMGDVVNAVANAVGQAFSAAMQVGQAIWNGINSILQRHSPGFIHDQVKAEFQTDLPSAIGGATQAVYDNAQLVGQAMVDGVTPSMSTLNNSMTSALSQASMNMPQLDPMSLQVLQVDGMDANANQDALMQYQSDATLAEQINTTTASNTQATFTGLGSVADNTFKGIGTSMVTAYTGMNTNQTTLLSNMQNQNKTAYNNMQNQTTSSLNNMRNSTVSLTSQMTSAWMLMKNNIVSAANQLKSESTSHFNQLSSTIGSFYRKLQNPGSWGAGDPDSTPRQTNRGRYNRGMKAVNRAFGHHGAGGKGASIPHSSFGHHGAGGTPYNLPKTMSVDDLLKMMCPNGSCLSGHQKVDVDAFLGSFTEGGFGSWSDWHPTHFNKIKSTSNEWDMKSPQIMGWIDTNTNFKVKDFLNGQPQISFDEFRSMAEALFSAIPYDFYYDSAKCGNWVAALQSGSVNCSDGADALVALAHTCGFSAYKQHGHWNGLGHYFAVVNGQKMDTTGWQQRRTWTPSASAGSPPKNMDVGNTTTNSYKVSVVIEGDVYGVDDLESKIDSGVQEGLAKAMNTSNIIGV